MWAWGLTTCPIETSSRAGQAAGSPGFQIGYDRLAHGSWNGDGTGWHAIKRREREAIGAIEPGGHLSKAPSQGEPSFCCEIGKQQPTAGLGEEYGFPR